MAAHFVLGPIGWKLGSAISAVVYAGITGSLRVVFGALFGFFYAPLVITGLHHMTNAIDTQLVADFGGTMLWPMIALSNIAQGSAVLGMMFLQRKDAEKQEVNVPSGISCYLGVTEPAMFGVNLKYVFPFICGMIGSATAGVLSTAMRCTANSIGVGGIPGILSMQSQSMLPYLLCMVTAVVIPFVLTVAVGKTKGVDRDAEAAAEAEAKGAEADAVLAAAETDRIFAPVSGRVIPVEEINDGVFSEKTLGDGVGIIPEDGVIVAPCTAKVTTLIDDSKHAIGLVLGNGVELLIHVGLDTVNMKGTGFAYKAVLNDVVKAGDPLIIFDRDKIRAAGYSDTVVFVVTDPGDKEIKMLAGQHVEAARDAVMKIG